MKGDLHQVLIQPLLTEKLTALREQTNTVGFLVHPNANKIQIKQAVETLLKVKVSRLNGVSDCQADRRQNIALLAVLVVQQGDSG